MSDYDWGWYFDAPDYPWDSDRIMVGYYARDERALVALLTEIRRTQGLRVEKRADTFGQITEAQCIILERRGLVRRLPEGDNAVRFIPR